MIVEIMWNIDDRRDKQERDCEEKMDEVVRIPSELDL